MELNEIIKCYDFALSRSSVGFMIFKTDTACDLDSECNLMRLKLKYSKDIKIGNKSFSFDHLLNKNISDVFSKITDISTALNIKTTQEDRDSLSRKLISFTDKALDEYKFSFYVVKIPPNALYIAFEDITKEIKLEKEMVEIISKLEQLKREHQKTDKSATNLKKKLSEVKKEKDGLEDFTGRAVHDLKTPLITIQGFGKLLQKEVNNPDNKNEKIERFATIIAKNASKLWLLIDDLLEFSKTKNKKLDFTDVNLQNVIKEIMEDLKIDIESRHAQISCSNLPSIKANKTSVKSLFQNLISNALKYSRPDTDPVINIYHKTPENDAEKFSIIVRDNGVGMKDDTLSRITMPFVRVKNKKDTEEGTGLGLSICKEIVDKLEGNISFSSSPTKGTEAIISLPKKILL